MTVLKSESNQTVKDTIKLKTNAKERRKKQLFIAEGLRLCNEALLSNAEIYIAFFTENFIKNNEEAYNNISENAKKTYIVTENIFTHISDTDTPQGVLCVIKTLDKTMLFDKIKFSGNYILLENIQDPGNLGTILRTIDAFNINGVFLSKGCCDIYNPKVIRGSMGAVFRVPFNHIDDVTSFIKEFNKTGTSYGAVLDNSSVPLNNVDFKNNSLIIIGNEGSGLTKATTDSCNIKTYIPMSGDAESLNAGIAAAIFMWEMIK